MKKGQFFIIAAVLIALIIIPSLWFFKSEPREKTSEVCISLFQNIKSGIIKTIDDSLEYNGFGGNIDSNLDNFSVVMDEFCAGNSVECFLNHSVYNVIDLGGGGPTIWTTREDCGTEDKNVNKYCLNDSIYMNGGNFDPGWYYWEVVGQPSSCDPNTIVANGTYYVSGPFCFFVYRVDFDDCKGYKVQLDVKSKNYQVDESCTGGEPTIYYGPNAGINITVKCGDSYLHDYFEYP